MPDSNPFPTIMHGSETLFFRGNDTGCLCLHGFMASPNEVAWLGQHLADQGYTVYVPRITGHGANPYDMKRMRWRDWYLGALDGYHLLRQQCSRVFVAGLSMGGLLTLLLASTVLVEGAAALATPLRPSASLITQTPWLKYVLRYTWHHDNSALPGRIREEQTRRSEPVVGRVHYAYWSTKAVAELYALMQVTRRRLPQITAPLLLVNSEQDGTVPLENQAWIAQSVSSPIVERHTLHDSSHILTQDVEREQVFGYVADFFARQLINS